MAENLLKVIRVLEDLQQAEHLRSWMCTGCNQQRWATDSVKTRSWSGDPKNYCGPDFGGRSYGQLVMGSFIRTTHWLLHQISCRVFDETSNHPGDLAPLQLRFGALSLLAFPKTKIIFEREEIPGHQWNSAKCDRAADGNSNKGFCRVFWTVEEALRGLCEFPRCLLWRVLRCHRPIYNVTCILYLFQ